MKFELKNRPGSSSKEAEKLAATILARDGSLPEQDAFDSNCITPGTDFMLKLGLAMRKWIEYKQKTDPVWKNGCDVVVSGPDVPGEGEHKVRYYVFAYDVWLSTPVSTAYLTD